MFKLIEGENKTFSMMTPLHFSEKDIKNYLAEKYNVYRQRVLIQSSKTYPKRKRICWVFKMLDEINKNKAMI